MTLHHPSERPSLDRDRLIGAITTFLAGQSPTTLDIIRSDLERTIDEAGAGALAVLDSRLAGATAWDYYPPDPLARQIHRVIADRMLPQASALIGSEHAAAVAGSPVVIFANHLSYSDANLLEILLHRGGAAALADRLTVAAGPKVYSSARRHFSSLCFGTVKTPQTSSRSSEDAVMDAREVARAARKTINAVHERLRCGDAVLVFAEGTRSRTGVLQPMLPGASRYLDGPAALILPMSIVGTDAMFPIGDETLYAVPIVAAAGRPFAAIALRDRTDGDRRLMMDVVGCAIAELLPPECRGAYGGDSDALAAARRLLGGLYD